MMSLTLTPPRLPAAWRVPFGAVLLLLVAILLLYRDTGAAMIHIWIRSETFTHAFVVPPIVGWLIWRKRGELAPLQPVPSLWALLPMAGAVVLWWLGELVNVAAATQTALAVMLVASVPLVLGWRVAATLAFPLAFLFFAVPIGEFMTPTLMHWTADVLVASLRLTGIPVYQEGQHLVIPSGRWAVVEACSGIRYLMATFMVGSLFAYLNYQDTRKRLVFVAVSLVLPVLANWMRAYIIVMLGHLSDNQIATGVDHLIYGWIFFGIVILALFFVGARWADPDDTEAAEATAVNQAALRADRVAPAWQQVGVAGLAFVVLALPNFGRLHAASDAATSPVRLQLPDTLGRWQALPRQEHGWAPVFPQATVKLVQDYKGPGGEVSVYIDYFRDQRPGAKLVTSTNRFAAGPRWLIASEGLAESSADGRTIAWRRATLTTTDGADAAGRLRLTVWRLYWLGGPVARGDIKAMLIQAWRGVLGEQDDGAAIHLATTLPDDAAAQRLLSTFVGENFAMLERALATAKASR